MTKILKKFKTKKLWVELASNYLRVLHADQTLPARPGVSAGEDWNFNLNCLRVVLFHPSIGKEPILNGTESRLWIFKYFLIHASYQAGYQVSNCCA